MISDDIKESLAIVSVDGEGEDCDSSEYKMPPGPSLQIPASARWRCSEVLFAESHNIAAMVLRSIEATPVELHPLLFRNVVLSGATTLLSGFPERLQRELSCAAPPDTFVNVAAHPLRKYDVWVGGTLLANAFPREVTAEQHARGDHSNLRKVY